MNPRKFAEFAITEKHPNWKTFISREKDLYNREDEIRTPFGRDYTRILHSMAYRRLKHKTQVFFNIGNDHICTRMEHVSHVESVSSTIAAELGLNIELTKAISVGHDLGHAPFGHQGETVIRKLSEKHLNERFWHERNGVRFVDKIELLEDNYRKSQNLNLTYGVRDGIISHCGEVDENGIKPREELIDLAQFKNAGEFQSASWEGCVVKISDKIAYLGRDIEDARLLGILDETSIEELLRLARANDQNVLNTTVIMHNMIIDICKNSTPERGISLSDQFLKQINEIKRFNTEKIYYHDRLTPFKHYSELVINEIFNALLSCYDGKHTWDSLQNQKKYMPKLMNSFAEWLAKYCNEAIVPSGPLKTIALDCINEKIYGDLNTKEIYIQAILDYIAGMTDRFAIELFNELITY